VDYFLSLPGYVAHNQRLWADKLQYDNRNVWYRYLIDLDDQVGRLYRSELSYPNFAAIVASHPGFVGQFVGENVVAYAFQAFLGRDALPEERQDLLGLYRMWRTRGGYDPSITRFRYNACIDDTECDPGRSCIDNLCQSTTNYRELYLDPKRCADALGQLSCTSAAHGQTVALAGTAPIALGELTDDEWQVLRSPGRILSTMPAFWEAAVDDVLNKYLGWWHGGNELPGYELPQLRQALAVGFQATGGDVRALEREVLLSALYLMAADEPAGDTRFWHYGPTKQMIAEAWIDSVGRFAGLDVGRCDPRFPNLTPRWLPPTLVPGRGQLPGFDYPHEARLLGGCPDQEAQFRYTDVGVLATMEQRSIVAGVCASPAATAFLPPQGTTSERMIEGLYRRAFTAEAGDDATAVAALVPAADASARNLCLALLRSARFLFY
jgi:hypothetical protein